jgi:hypothetical protein
MSPKSIITLVVVFIVLIVGAVICVSAVGVKSPQENIVMQPVMGNAKIVEKSGGLYVKAFAQTWSYPKYIEFRYNDEVGDGDKDKESVSVTFNDGGTADISTYIRLQIPTAKEELLAFHEQFGGVEDNIKASIKSYMIDCMKSTAPLMSASENQSAQKSYFRQMIENQLRDGVYEMNLEEVIKKDETDETGNEITIFKTSIKLVDGKPVITNPSPITEKFHMTLIQFSVTGTDYDIETRKQFAAKKDAFLGAEQAKAERSKEVQERLMIVEKGLREMAEATAAANVVKEKAVVEAQQLAEVALQVKIEKETEAEMTLSVATIAKEEAQIKLDIAKIEAEATIETAKAEQEKIALAGAITELEQAQIDAEVKIMSMLANSLPLMQVPSTVISGGSAGADGKSGAPLQDNMMSLIMLKMIGGENLADFGKVKSVNAEDRKVLRNRQQTSSVTVDSDVQVALN